MSYEDLEVWKRSARLSVTLYQNVIQPSVGGRQLAGGGRWLGLKTLRFGNGLSN